MPRPGKTHRAGAGPVPCASAFDLSNHIPTKIAVFANRMQRSASRYYRKRYGIGVVEWRLVMFIGQVTQTRANRICSETDLDKGAVSRSLGVLQRLGIVGIEGDGADGRRNNISLTEKGRALHDEMVPTALNRQSELVADLSKAEVEILINLIDRLRVKVADGRPWPNEPQLEPPPPSPPRKRASRQGKPPSGRGRTRRKK